MGLRGLVAACALWAIAGGAGTAAAQVTLPDVDVTLVVDVADTAGWLTLYQEVLATPRETPKPLTLATPGVTGGDRWITVANPRFASTMTVAGPARGFRVVVSGTVAGAEAVRSLVPFEQAALAMQAGATENRVTIAYGLSSVSAQLVEMRLARQ